MMSDVAGLSRRDEDMGEGGVIDVRGLRMRYGSVDVLKGVEFVVRRGGDRAGGDEAWRAGVGVVLQSWRDHGKWRVGELLYNLGRYYSPYSTPERKRPHDADALVKMVGLEEHAGKKISTLSGGQRRRLDVAIGIVGKPELLFLDEPTAGFDPHARREFHD